LVVYVLLNGHFLKNTNTIELIVSCHSFTGNTSKVPAKAIFAYYLMTTTMAELKFRDLTVHTNGNLPPVGSMASDFTLVNQDMKEVSLSDFAGKNIVLNIFPSIDTRVCAMSVREFNKRASELKNTVVLCISHDLPFAFKRFCGAEGIENVVTLSDFRTKAFGKSYGVELVDGPFAGLHARVIVVIDHHGKVVYTELVPVIGQEPDYEKAIGAVG
jgi:thioredoxin-dependent peroxiredoxin